ncbi:MAG: hypothetical protein HZA34_03365 [Candidatus Pacebacteria bacterium]|nr:hypothetical protein [Candidatus Paceibacterota bacterium]
MNGQIDSNKKFFFLLSLQSEDVEVLRGVDVSGLLPDAILELFERLPQEIQKRYENFVIYAGPGYLGNQMLSESDGLSMRSGT